MKKITYIVGTIWRSDMRNKILVELLLTILFILLGVISNLLGTNVWSAQLSGFWAGVFFGYGIFNSMEVFMAQRQRDEFSDWTKTHVRDEITKMLEAKGLVGHVVFSADHPPPEKMN